MSIGFEGSNSQGPILGDRDLYEDLPLAYVDQVRSRYNCWAENFQEAVADIAAMETLGWTETAVGAPTAASVLVVKSPATVSFLRVNCGTAADTGSNLQLNADPTTGAINTPHRSVGPLTIVATSFDNRDLIFRARVGVMHAVSGWTSKFVIGFCVTDTSIMDPATGALTLSADGGMLFHVTEAGAINFVSQRGATPTTVQIGTMPTPSSASTIGNWMTLGFRARYRDASDAANNGSVDVYKGADNSQLVKVATLTNVLPTSSASEFSVTIEAINGPATSPNLDLGVSGLFTAITKPGF